MERRINEYNNHSYWSDTFRKTTIGNKLVNQLGIRQCSIDEVRFDYYTEIGCSTNNINIVPLKSTKYRNAVQIIKEKQFSFLIEESSLKV
jgi:hypothetical protein